MELVASYPQHNKKIANRKHVAPPHLLLKATYNCKTGFFGQIFVTLLKCRKMNGDHEAATAYDASNKSFICLYDSHNNLWKRTKESAGSLQDADFNGLFMNCFLPGFLT